MADRESLRELKHISSAIRLTSRSSSLPDKVKDTIEECSRTNSKKDLKKSLLSCMKDTLSDDICTVCSKRRELDVPDEEGDRFYAHGEWYVSVESDLHMTVKSDASDKIIFKSTDDEDGQKHYFINAEDEEGNHEHIRVCDISPRLPERVALYLDM